MPICRAPAPRRFAESISLESVPDVRFYLRFSAMDADELANFISPPRWGDLCRVALGFVQDWEGVLEGNGQPVPWSAEEFYNRLTAAERLEFASAAVELVFGDAANPTPTRSETPMPSSASVCGCSSPGSSGAMSGEASPTTSCSTGCCASTPA